MLVINLSFNMKDKKKTKDTKGKDGKKDRKDKKKAEKEDTEQNTIAFSPDLGKCGEYLNSALSMIVESTNKVSNLEDDLMPFLQKPEKTANFAMTEDFEWIIEARDNINMMTEENIVGPLELLNNYKQYEYVLNVDKKSLLKELFNGEAKATL